jgi:hypothetical protein
MSYRYIADLEEEDKVELREALLTNGKVGDFVVDGEEASNDGGGRAGAQNFSVFLKTAVGGLVDCPLAWNTSEQGVAIVGEETHAPTIAGLIVLCCTRDYGLESTMLNVSDDELERLRDAVERAGEVAAETDVDAAEADKVGSDDGAEAGAAVADVDAEVHNGAGAGAEVDVDAEVHEQGEALFNAVEAELELASAGASAGSGPSNGAHDADLAGKRAVANQSREQMLALVASATGWFGARATTATADKQQRAASGAVAAAETAAATSAALRSVCDADTADAAVAPAPLPTPAPAPAAAAAAVAAKLVVEHAAATEAKVAVAGEDVGSSPPVVANTSAGPLADLAAKAAAAKAASRAAGEEEAAKSKEVAELRAALKAANERVGAAFCALIYPNPPNGCSFLRSHDRCG